MGRAGWGERGGAGAAGKRDRRAGGAVSGEWVQTEYYRDKAVQRHNVSPCV